MTDNGDHKSGASIENEGSPSTNDKALQRRSQAMGWPSSRTAQIIEACTRLIEAEPIRWLTQDSGLGDVLTEVFASAAGMVRTGREAAGYAKNRFIRWASRAREEIPAEKLEPPPRFLLPDLRGFWWDYADAESWYYVRMFEQLLTKACHRDQQTSIMPWYPTTIRELAPDEAYLLWVLHTQWIPFQDPKEIGLRWVFANGRGMQPPPYWQHGMVDHAVPEKLFASLAAPSRLTTYKAHMQKLLLVDGEESEPQRLGDNVSTFLSQQFASVPQDIVWKHLEGVRHGMWLTREGRQFTEVCIPEQSPLTRPSPEEDPSDGSL